LEINKGEFVAIVGPSGSGKSTLLLALGGMSAPSAGTVAYDTNSIYKWSIATRAKWRGTKVGFVFQAFNLIPYLTVYENVSAGLSLSGDKCIAEEKIHPLLEKMKLADRKDHLPSELSVGQQQRVALARALVKTPELILADEPTGNLDRETGKEVMDILKRQHGAGTTAVIITHDPEIAKMAERTIRIIEGRIAKSK
jgi:putative ABC transport system ATP-binding protein